jgi:hypothetical protein
MIIPVRCPDELASDQHNYNAMFCYIVSREHRLQRAMIPVTPSVAARIDLPKMTALVQVAFSRLVLPDV